MTSFLSPLFIPRINQTFNIISHCAAIRLPYVTLDTELFLLQPGQA